MITSEERRTTEFPSNPDEQTESGRSAPIDEDVEGELNAALPEPREEEEEEEEEEERSQTSS
jgi:hypothetical protein